MSLGVWLLGATGNVGACVTAGWAAVRAGAIAPIGLATCAPPLDQLELAPLDGVRFGGHDIASRTLAEAVQRLVAEGVLAASAASAPAVVDAIAAAQAELRPGIARDASWDALVRVRNDLAAFRDRHQLDRVVVINVASTEAALAVPVPGDHAVLIAALRAGLALPPSVLYALAALELGMGYVNFTPSPGSDLPALHELALARGAVHAGADGKTGQTLVKTALAPMFSIRQLRVASWISHNILGNEDGRTLDDPELRESKVRSKGAALASILGYAPESRVAIEYAPSYGDWKVAWDRIVFEGFGGAVMTMEMTWRGSDTALAAPLCIDLARLVELAQRRGERGVLGYLGVFFKRPIGSTEHRLERQWQALVEHLTRKP